MLVLDLMTKNVITIRRDACLLDALYLMEKHGLRRLPVVDEDDRLVGVISQRSIEELKPQSKLPALVQSNSWATKHTVDEVMHAKVVTVRPTDTVEIATTKAQTSKVGALIVLDDNKIVGIVTTNDIFYKIVNPTLGIGESGSRVVVVGGGTGEHTEKILSIINKMGIKIKVIWAVFSQINLKNNLVVHLETEDARNVVGELARHGYETKICNR